MTAEDLQVWVSGLDALFARVAGRFGRVEPRRQARAYVMGLLAPVERKNGWQLAEAAGDSSPDRMQRLLGGARWDPREVRVDLRAYVVENLGHRDAVLIVDETGFIKKGTKSAGVQRQYSRTAGRVENCQLGVFLAYASPLGRALIDAELYLPESWTATPARCAEAGIPQDVEFTTKPALAWRMLAQALDAGVPVSWATADEAYGMDGRFRHFLEQRGVSYVVAVPRSQVVAHGLADGDTHADSLVAGAPPEAWKRMSASDGSKGPRLYDWALATVHFDAEPGYRRGSRITKSDCRTRGYSLISRPWPPRRREGWALLGLGGSATRPQTATLPAAGRLIPSARRPVTPGIAGTTLIGAHLDVRGLQGNVVVANFWASWCAPCKAEIPALRTLAQRLSPRGVRFVGVDVRDNRTSAMALERHYRISYPSIFDPDYAVTAAMGRLTPRATPTTYLIDKRGRLAAVFFGSITYKVVEPMLVPLAAEPPA